MTGATFVLVGHPVSHSLSPAIHHAAYVELGLEGNRYLAVDCPDEGAVRRVVDGVRRGEYAGANVTVPWKRLALELADEVDPSAQKTGAVNVIAPSGGGRVRAHNTDVPALADELSRGRAAARSAMILGNGGAALAAVAACRLLGMARVVVTARRWRGAPSAAWEHEGAFRALGAEVFAWPEDPGAPGAFHDAAVASDVIVQSTSDGMRGATDGSTVRDVVPWSALESDTFAYDVVYNPATTPFVAAARARGLRAESGLGMLVGQAALAIEIWTSRRPKAGPLRAAAERALAEKFGT